MSCVNSIKYGRDYALGKCIQSALRVSPEGTFKGITAADYAYRSTKAVANHITWHLYRRRFSIIKRYVGNCCDFGMYFVEDAVRSGKRNLNK